MKHLGTLTAVLVILMAGFMSVCSAAEDCAPAKISASAHDCAEMISSKSEAPVKEAKKETCEMSCHVSVQSVPQMNANLGSSFTGREVIVSFNEAVMSARLAAPDQPPRIS